MMYTQNMLGMFLGIILLLAPFSLVFYFKDRFRGFLYVLMGNIALHLAIALLTQISHIFLYQVIVAIHLIVATVTFFILIKKKVSLKFRINWFVVFAFIIIIFELWSVHFLYTGMVSTVNGYQPAVKSVYPYPYFSDEWVGVSLSNHSIGNNALPNTNPLINGNNSKNSSNVFVCFFALVSELFLLLNVSPLLGYPFFAIGAGFLICLLAYVLLRVNKARSIPSLLAVLCIPYIVNGSNLPGIWYLLPFIGGSILFLLSLTALSMRERPLAWLSGFLALLLYPPLIVFIGPTFIIDVLLDEELKVSRKLKRVALGLFAVACSALVTILLKEYNLGKFLSTIVSYIFRPNQDGGIPSYAIWNVIPIVILPVALLGFMEAFRKKMFLIFIPVLVGLSFWGVYNYIPYFFIIDYARVAVITSFLIVILSGFGFDRLSKKITEAYPALTSKNAGIAAGIFSLTLFLFLSFSYTDQPAWTKLTLHVGTPNGEQEVLPGAPANHYLTEEDLNLFRPISGARFLSIPWKGLTIGAATGNYPVQSKASIITNNFLDYNEFMSADCAGKKTLADKVYLKYAYSQEFQCPDFNDIGSSSEGLHLYKFNP